MNSIDLSDIVYNTGYISIKGAEDIEVSNASEQAARL
jgi:hypothetical protein